MKLWLKRLVTTFFRPELDFRVRLFNLLAMIGTVNSLIAAAFSLLIVGGLQVAAINLLAAGLAVGLLCYSNSSGQYHRCYLITIILVFFVGFAFLFLSGGGYRGGFPSFFIFSTVFTVFMLDGWKMLVITALELLFYIGLCLYGYYVPEQVVWFTTEEEILSDVIVSFVSVSIVLGITMYLSFRLYKNQQRQLEQARQEAIRANQAKSLFLASMSHEIRTPINIMLGMNEMVLREQPSPTIAGYITRSQDAGQMLLSLINDILDVAKIESGKTELLEEAYYTDELVQRLIQLGREQAEKKGLSFSAEVSGLPAMLWGDTLHIRQIAANFLSNAVKYTESGSVRLALTGKEMAGGDGVLFSIAVTDTGIGIPPETIDSLFDAFTRSEAARNLKIEGTGLGLAIVRNLVNLMGGRLFVQSEYGSGSMFTAEIPQRYAAEMPDSPLGSAGPLAEQSFFAPQGRILVVDDNEGNLGVVTSLLARTLLQIDTALSGRQCLELAGQNHYHVILLDYMMPQMDGIRTLQRLRQMDCHIPVIALTADVTAGTRQKLLNAGFAEYLSKPVSWTGLEQTLLSYLPAPLVTRTTVSAGNACPDAALKIRRQLKQYDISLETGLQFLSQSLSQYKTIVGIFLTHTRQTADLLTQLAARHDLAALAHSAHSLKTLARVVGAGELSALARRIELKCSTGEAAYVQTALPLFLHELETARRGLAQCIPQDQETSADKAPASLQPDFTALLDGAQAHIAGYHCAESRQVLTLLLSLEQDPAGRRLLEQARTAVDNLSFEDAEGIFQLFCTIRRKEEVPFVSEK